MKRKRMVFWKFRSFIGKR